MKIIFILIAHVIIMPDWKTDKISVSFNWSKQKEKKKKKKKKVAKQLTIGFQADLVEIKFVWKCNHTKL